MYSSNLMQALHLAYHLCDWLSVAIWIAHQHGDSNIAFAVLTVCFPPERSVAWQESVI